MAFVKNQHFVYDSIVPKKSGSTDGKISIPLVITKEDGKYHGFTPGIVMQDIIDDDLQVVNNKLTDYIKKVVLEMIKQKQRFPFFPTNDLIKHDFKGVVSIKRITVKVDY